MRIVAFDSDMAGDAFEAALGLRRRIDAADDPEVGPMPPAELRAYMDDRTENSVHHRYVAFDDAGPLALGHLQLPDDVHNLQLSMIEVEVEPGRDRRPARPLVGHLLDRARAAGRTSMMAFGRATDAEGAEWEDLGLTLRMVERHSVLDVAAVDAELMQAWVAEGRERSPELSIVEWTGRCPDEHLDALVATRNAMNDAPLDDLDWNDEEWTAAAVRADERAWRDVGFEVHGVMAVAPGGEAAGMTGVFVRTHRPQWSWQADTVVLEPFRGRRIGRWLKAAMWERIRAERPEVRRLETENASSNEHMLAINVAMGYREHDRFAVWQADISDIRGPGLHP